MSAAREADGELLELVAPEKEDPKEYALWSRGFAFRILL